MKQALLIGPRCERYHIDFLSALIARESYVHIIAVDGGMSACMQAGLIPTLFVGDGDSITPEALDYVDMMQVERIDLAVRKDDSDFGHALTWLSAQHVSSFEAIGFGGGRLDHQLAVIGETEKSGLDGLFFDEIQDTWVVTQSGRLPKKIVLSKAEYANFSVFTLSESARVSVAGALWPLDQESLRPLESRGLSNEFALDAFDARVLVHSGTVLVVGNRSLFDEPSQ